MCGRCKGTGQERYETPEGWDEWRRCRCRWTVEEQARHLWARDLRAGRYVPPEAFQ